MKYAKAAVGAVALATVLISSTTWAQDVRSASAISSTASADWSMEVVAEGLDYPWEIQQTGGRILITEAAGDVVSIEGARMVHHPVETSDPIARVGGGGLLGMALSKDFESSGTAYFYHTYQADGGLSNKVIEARFDGTSWKETRTLLKGIPGHRLYNGGRVAIGPDGYLYVTTGWTENRQRPPDISSLAARSCV